MAYHVYRVKDKRIVDEAVIVAADDKSAIEHATKWANGEQAELWDGPHWVRSIKSIDE